MTDHSPWLMDVDKDAMPGEKKDFIVENKTVSNTDASRHNVARAIKKTGCDETVMEVFWTLVSILLTSSEPPIKEILRRK